MQVRILFGVLTYRYGVEVRLLNKTIQCRFESDRRDQMITINEDGLTIINGKYGPMNKKSFYVKLCCGCCTTEMKFNDRASIEAAFKAAGLDSSATITDDEGTVHTEVDTFYGYSSDDSEQSERSIGYLWNSLSGQ